MTGKIDKDTGLFGSADLEKLPDKGTPKEEKNLFNNLQIMQTGNRKRH